MTMVLYVKTPGEMIGVANRLSRVGKNVPDMTREGMRRWGQVLERDMKFSAMQAGIKASTGTLQTTGIDYRQGKQSDWGYLFIRQYGVFLDSMRPHHVAITRRRSRLLQWASMAGSPEIRQMAADIQAGRARRAIIFVRPHPFIMRGYTRARPKLRPILNQELRRGLAS